MRRIRVTPDEVEAARIEVQAFEAAGLRPDPLVRALAMAQPMGTDEPVAEDQIDEPSAEGLQCVVAIW